LVVYSLSRQSRSTKDTRTVADLLVKKEADLVSLSAKIDTTSAAGEMVFRLLAVLSEFERDQISGSDGGGMIRLHCAQHIRQVMRFPCRHATLFGDTAYREPVTWENKGDRQDGEDYRTRLWPSKDHADDSQEDEDEHDD